MLHNSDKQEDIVIEESNQIKESQPMIEKVKQAPGKREQPISPQRNIITTGNSFSRLSKLIYHNSLTCRRDNHGFFNFTCLVFE